MTADNSALEYMPVIVNGMPRQFPIQRVKIVEDLGSAGANVIVSFPSYSLDGMISLETKRRFFAKEKPSDLTLNRTFRTLQSNWEKEEEEKGKRDLLEALEELRQQRLRGNRTKPY